MKLSIIIPVYNEKLLLREIITRCLTAPIPQGFNEREIIVVDDGSSDGTTELLKSLPFDAAVKVHHSHINHGKGCAVRVGFKISTGDVIIIQDGDMEYDPIVNYEGILVPFTKNKDIQVVYGSRFLDRPWPQGMKLSNLIANYILTWSTRVLYNCRITDEATGYKVFRKDVLDLFKINARGFEFCPEFTAKVLRAGLKIEEVPICYNARNQFNGKKIKARDGFIALWTLIKVRIQPTI